MKKIKQFILPLVLPVVLMGLMTIVALLLLGCPTAAPKEKDKGGGDDGNDDPVVIKEVDFVFVSPHSIVANITAKDDIDGETTLVITESADELDIPNPAVITDGFIERELIKDTSRKVYMAQNFRAFNTGDSLGTHSDDGTAKLHAAFLKPDTEYYLHLLYKKQDETTLTHKSFYFKTADFSKLGADGGKPTTSFTATPNPAMDVIEWRKDKENYLIGWGLNKQTSQLNYNFDDATTLAAYCSPETSEDAIDCTRIMGIEVVLFSSLKDDYTIMWVLHRVNSAFSGTNNPRETTATYGDSSIIQKVLIVDK